MENVLIKLESLENKTSLKMDMIERVKRGEKIAPLISWFLVHEVTDHDRAIMNDLMGRKPVEVAENVVIKPRSVEASEPTEKPKRKSDH